MKRIISNVMLVAAAAMAFFACQKPEAIESATSEEVMLTFSSEKPAFDDETKTEWTGETIQWSAGDKISVAYTVKGNWQNASGDASGDAKLYKSEELIEASAIAQFNVSTYFEGTTEGTHVFYGVYPAPSSTNIPDSPVATLTVAPSQTPKADSFDSNGDLMIGVSKEYGSRPDKDETISLKWERLVAHAVISLMNINGLTADEKIENITLTAQDDANLVGQQKVNLITKEVVKDNAIANVLKLGASNLAVNNGVLSFWACVLPETVTSLKVMVETDKAYYTREIPSCNLVFKKNARNTLSIKMNDAVREEKVVASDEVVDVLTRSITGATSTTYVDWSGKTLTSSAVYAGNSAGGNESIQLRSNNSNSGIVTTTSGGFAKKVALTWESNTANGRTLNVYGSNSAYSAPTDLYDNAKAGTKLGTIVCGTSTELVIDGDYEYIGLRSNSGAMYLSEIKITWSTGSVTPDTTPSVKLETEELKLNAEESEGTIEVYAKNIASIEVRALEEEGSQIESDWLIADYDEENSLVTYTAEANESEESRTAYIEVYCLDADANEVIAGISVTQRGKIVVDDSFEEGLYWIIGTKNSTTKVMTPLAADKTYGYASGADLIDGRTFAANAFKFTAVSGGFTIQDASGKYYYQEASTIYKTFNVGTDASLAGCVWTVALQNDGTAIVTNAASGKVVKYADGTYTSFGVYGSGDDTADNAGVYPILVKADNPIAVELESISVLGQNTLFELGDDFVFGGTVTATYNDGSQKTVTPTSVSEPNMDEAGTYEVTVSYTEGTITKTATYNITVTDPNAGEDDEVKVPSSTACYTLSTASVTGTNNSYAGNCDITVNNIKWNVNGNTQTNPWRIGGKNLTKVNRTVYSKTAYSSALSKVEFVAGSTTATWHSLTLEYSTNSSFSDAQSIVVNSVAANTTISFAPEGGFPENCYFRFTLNVTAGGSNQYVQLKEIKFYGYEN